jgi:hypothetical protein
VFGFHILWFHFGEAHLARNPHVAQAPARLCGCLICVRCLRSDVVVDVVPKSQFAAGIIQRVEQFVVKQSIPQTAVEAFDKSILLRFFGVYVMRIQVVIAGLF